MIVELFYFIEIWQQLEKNYTFAIGRNSVILVTCCDFCRLWVSLAKSIAGPKKNMQDHFSTSYR